MARPRNPLDAQKHAQLVEDLLHTERPGPRRERLLAVGLGFDSTNDLEKAAAAGDAPDPRSNCGWTRFVGGVEALLNDGRTNNPGRPDSLTREPQQALDEGLKDGLWRTVSQMRAALTKEFGITLKLGSLYNRLGKAGARLRVPRPRHQNQNPADAVSFRKELCTRTQLKDSLCNRVFESLAEQRDCITAWLQA